ncbi:MAG: hypothetical protein P9L99_00995 [Candidatus Lernaella stagnicola]|nr:hypothetical protein [Candidatus Lernaella stagnicola]
MTGKFRFVWLAVLAVVVLTAGACTEPVIVEEVAECEGNRAPQIRNLVMVVDHHDDNEGWMIEEPPNPDSTVFVSKFDRIVVWFEIGDQDCNLDDGRIFWSLDADNFAPVERIQLTEKQSCRGKSFWRFIKEDLDLGLAQGYGYEIPAQKLESLTCDLHEFSIGVTDVCAEPSPETLNSSFYIRFKDCF